MDALNLNVAPLECCSGRDPLIFCRFELSPDFDGYSFRPYRSKVWIICCPKCQSYVEAPDLIRALSTWRDRVLKGRTVNDC